MEKKNDFFRSRIVYIILSVIIACALWLYVVSVENPDIDKEISNIPVTFAGEDELLEDRGFMLTGGKESYVTLRLRGKRTDITKLDRKNITISVDISSITAVGEYSRAYTITYPTGVSEADLSVVSRSPALITFTIVKQASKEVEIRGVLDGDVAEGYLREDFEFDPGTVTIRGAEEAIAEVDHALVTLSRTNVNKTIETTSAYTLMNKEDEPVDMEGIILDVEEVSVRLPILQQKEVYLKLDLIPGGGAAVEDAKVTIDPEYIVVAGDPTVLSTLNSITIASVDLYDVINTTTETKPIILPNGIKNISGETEATYTISLESLQTRSIEVTEFELINTPDGYTAESVTQMLRVTIRGRAGTVDQILESNVVAVADLSGVGTGTMAVPVEVKINANTDAGVVGNYTIYVMVTKDT